MYMSEEKSLRGEIETLNKDNERKARVILELYNVILKTGDINLLAQAGEAMKYAQKDECLKSN